MRPGRFARMLAGYRWSGQRGGLGACYYGDCARRAVEYTFASAAGAPMPDVRCRGLGVLP